MKGPQDFLTETDAAVERHVKRAIAEAFPDDAFLGEETGGSAGRDTWVVDPIDGTANFARGVPHFCVSIAFVRDGATEIGAICNPALGELHFARRGAGATRNGAADPGRADPRLRLRLRRARLVDPGAERALRRGDGRPARHRAPTCGAAPPGRWRSPGSPTAARTAMPRCT